MAGQKRIVLEKYDVVVHNDDRHTMDEVVAILCDVFGYPSGLAVKLMYQIHAVGVAFVARNVHEELAETYAARLRRYGLKVVLV